MFQARKRVGQVINGVVRRGQRAVAAGIQGRQLEIGVLLFAGLDVHVHRLSVLGRDAARIRIQREFGIDQVAMVLEQPVDAIRLAAFFIGGERQNQVAIGPIAFTP